MSRRGFSPASMGLWRATNAALQSIDIFLLRANAGWRIISPQERSLRKPTQDRRRLLAAAACLLATVLLYAPLARAAWSAHLMDCCTGGYCPIAHHHHKAPVSSADCDHSNAALSACSMSCCHDSQHPAITAWLFVLPALASASHQVRVSRVAQASPSVELPRHSRPLAPPPRAA